MNDRSKLTAIARTKPSRPARFLLEGNYIPWEVNPQDILDYGCGRGYDCDLYIGCDGYDPNWRPNRGVLTRRYGYIMCNFVMNVIPCEMDRALAIKNIQTLLREHGIAFVSVRNDKGNLKGFTSRGTWQGHVELVREGEEGEKPLEVEVTPSFRMWLIAKNMKIKVPEVKNG